MIILVPTRGRPENIVQLKQAIDDTATGTPRLIIAVDDDDPKLAEYADIGVEMVVAERHRLGPWLNILAERYADEDSILAFLGDDHRPRTPGWDKTIESYMSQKPLIVYGNDLIQGPNLPTAVFMSSAIVKAIGYMVPPGLVHMYIDNAWKALGQGSHRLVYINNVVIEHCHPIANKGVAWDDGYASVNNNEVMSGDHATFEEWCNSGALSTALEEIGRL